MVGLGEFAIGRREAIAPLEDMLRERGKFWSAWPIHGEARGENQEVEGERSARGVEHDAAVA